MAGCPGYLLHLVERFPERLLQFKRLLDLISGDVWVFSVFEETRALVITNKLDERGHVRFPVLGKSFQVLEDGVYTGFREQRDCIVSVFVEIGVEDALVHEIRLLADVEKNPAQVMELQGCKKVRIALKRLLDLFPIFAEYLLASRLDLGNDSEAVTCGRSGKHRPVLTLFQLKIAALRDRHRARLSPILFFLNLFDFRLYRH